MLLWSSDSFNDGRRSNIKVVKIDYNSLKAQFGTILLNVNINYMTCIGGGLQKKTLLPVTLPKFDRYSLV